MERLSISETGMTSSREDQTPTAEANRAALKGHHVNQTKSEGHVGKALWACDLQQNSAVLEHIIRDNGCEIQLTGCNGKKKTLQIVLF